MTSAVIFKDPPPSTGKAAAANELQAQAQELRANPQQWALLASKDTVSAAGAMAHKIRHGRYASFRPTGAFESLVRGTDVYARYVGVQP
jgi:hypothetical protein